LKKAASKTGSVGGGSMTMTEEGVAAKATLLRLATPDLAAPMTTTSHNPRLGALLRLVGGLTTPEATRRVWADLGDVICIEAVEANVDEVGWHLTSLKGGFELHAPPSMLLFLVGDTTPPFLIDLRLTMNFVDMPHLRALLPFTSRRQ
jgi:hypothetical protein